LTAARTNPLQPTPSEAETFVGGASASDTRSVAYKNFQIVFNAHFGNPSDAPVYSDDPFAYDAMMLAALAIESAGSLTDRVKIRDGLWAVAGEGPDHHAYGPSEYGDAIAAIHRGNAIHYVGASNKLILDSYGTPISSGALVWQVQNGAFATLEQFSDDDVLDVIRRTPATPDPKCQ